MHKAVFMKFISGNLNSILAMLRFTKSIQRNLYFEQHHTSSKDDPLVSKGKIGIEAIIILTNFTIMFVSNKMFIDYIGY